MKVRELFTDESKWTQHTRARDVNGRGVDENSPDAVCWCLTGAISHCYNPRDTIDSYVLESTIARKVEEALNGRILVVWNDNQDRTFKEVKALVERLDI